MNYRDDKPYSGSRSSPTGEENGTSGGISNGTAHNGYRLAKGAAEHLLYLLTMSPRYIAASFCAVQIS